MAMGLDRLWAPWRMEFIRSDLDQEGCFICGAADGSDDRQNLVVRRGSACFCLLNRYPYNNGHLLIAPFRHEGLIEALTSKELTEIMVLTVEAKKALDSTINPHGYNMGINLGRTAGAGLPEHLHLHVIPRWTGDTNFVTTAGSTKVIPQALEQLWAELHAHWEKSGRT